MKAMNRFTLATNITLDGIKKNKTLLLTGASLGFLAEVLIKGWPPISFSYIDFNKCYACIRPYTPYLGSAVAGAAIIGISKILLTSLADEMDRRDKERDKTTPTPT